MRSQKSIGFFASALMIIFFILPVFAADSSTSSQTVSVTVPEVTAVSADYGNENEVIIIEPIYAGITEIAINDVYFASLSNVDTEIWVKASSDLVGRDKSNIISLFNLKYSIPGNAKVEFTDHYVKVDKIARSHQGTKDSKSGVNLYIKVPYGTKLDTYTTTVYFTSLKLNSAAPV